MHFWDASAVVAVVVDESATPALRFILQEDPWMAVWWGTRVECLSALARRAREERGDPIKEVGGRRELDDLAASWSEVEPTAKVRSLSEWLLLLHALRAADSLQLAAALVWSEEAPRGRSFVCLDSRLREAAHKQGFTVLP